MARERSTRNGHGWQDRRARADQVGSVGIASTAAGSVGPGRVVLGRSGRGPLDFEILFNTFWDPPSRGWPRLHLRAGRPRLHARLRRAAADQLRPLRGLHAGDLRRFVFALWLGVPGREFGVGLFLLCVLRRLSSWRSRRWTAVLLERVAYRPLRSATHPACRADLRHRQLVRPSRKRSAGVGGTRRAAQRARSASSTTERVLDRRRRRPDSADPRHRLALYDGRCSACSSGGHGSGGACGQSPRTPRPPRPIGVNVDRVILLTFLIGGIMAGGAAFLYTIHLGVPPLQRRLPARHQGVHRRSAGRHRQPRGHCSVGSSSASSRTGGPACSAGSGSTSSPSSCWWSC